MSGPEFERVVEPREAVLHAMRLLRESSPSPAALAEIERIEAEWKTPAEETP